MLKLRLIWYTKYVLERCTKWYHLNYSSFFVYTLILKIYISQNNYVSLIWCCTLFNIDKKHESKSLHVNQFSWKYCQIMTTSLCELHHNDSRVQAILDLSSTFINRFLTHLPSTNLKQFFTSDFLIFSHSKTRFPKPYTHAFTVFQIFVPPLSYLGPNQLVNTTNVWK